MVTLRLKMKNFNIVQAEKLWRYDTVFSVWCNTAANQVEKSIAICDDCPKTRIKKEKKKTNSFLRFHPMLLLLSSEENANFNSYTENRMDKSALLRFHAENPVDLSWKNVLYTKDFRRESKRSLP